MRRPDLQELVAQYGRYDLIPPKAWEQFDREIEAWQRWVCRGGLHGAGPTVPSFTQTQPTQEYAFCWCGMPGKFGYSDPATKQIKWYCAQHRLAQQWADVRRGAA
jgi:hypothetical protein